MDKSVFMLMDGGQMVKLRVQIDPKSYRTLMRLDKGM
jgi:hypothetical protein